MRSKYIQATAVDGFIRYDDAVINTWHAYVITLTLNLFESNW